MRDDGRTYFATLPSYSEDMAAAVMARVDQWYQFLPETWWYKRAKKGYQLRYGLPSDASPFDVSQVGVGGEQGELSQVHVNALGNLVHRAVTMTVASAPTLRPVAANADYAAQAQTLVASSVLDYERRDKDMPRVFRQIADLAFTSTAGEQLTEWNSRAGGIYETDPATGTPIYNGQLKTTVFSPWDVMWNLAKRDANHNWKIVKEFWNKFDLITRHPQHEEEIVDLGADHPSLQNWRARRGQVFESEEVPVYRLFHRPTDSVEEGREVWVVNPKLVLFDGPSVYGPKLPVYRMCPGEVQGTGYGHSPVGDIVALQESFNMLISSALTNNANNAVAIVAVPRDAEMSRSDLAGGSIMEFDGPVAPQAMNFTMTAPETFKLAEMVKGYMSEFIGQSDTSMGKMSGAMSGTLAALLDSKTREFASFFQASMYSAMVDWGNATLDLYKRFAKTPRALEIIVGEDQRYLLPEFTGAKISEVSRVTVEGANPLLDTTAGKMELVNQLIASGQLQGPLSGKAILAVYRTGNLAAALSGPETEDMLIKSENAALQRGEVPVVRNDDQHAAHLAAHKVIGNTPEARKDMELMARLDQHCLGHVMAATNPMLAPLLLLTGQQPISLAAFAGAGAPAPADGTGKPVPGQQSEAKPPQQGQTDGSAGPTGQPGPDGMPSMPPMPRNPSDGQQAPEPQQPQAV